jgi:hypothetical protein
MSEIPINTQFVGKAEAPKKEAFVVTPEQQKIVDGMKKSGEVLENTIVDAREKAAQELKRLHAKELVDAGFKQVGHGAWETLKSEVKGSIKGGLIGGTLGAVGLGAVGGIAGRDAESAVVLGGAGLLLGGTGGAGIGGLVGYETAGLKYNKTFQENQNKVRWYDWVGSHVGAFGLDYILGKMPNKRLSFIASIVNHNLVNPISFAGFRKVAEGLYTMGKGKYEQFKAKN